LLKEFLSGRRFMRIHAISFDTGILAISPYVYFNSVIFLSNKSRLGIFTTQFSKRGFFT